MGKINKRLTIFIIFLLFVCTAAPVFAANTRSTGYTVTLNTDGEMQISQDAYIPSGVFLDLGLEKAESLFILNNKMYIADTGNHRALVVDLATYEMKVVGQEVLKQPRGISADVEGRIYIADFGTGKAYRFSEDGVIEQEFVKPTSPNFGKNAEFKPSKIAPADNGGIYLVSEGTVAGMVHMDKDGAFLGYFGAGDVSMSPFERMLKTVLNATQLQRYLHLTPPSFSNVFRGMDGLLYSVAKGSSVTVIKHNLGGHNMLKSKYEITYNEPKGISVTADGRIFVVELNGYVTEMTKEGYMLCSFSGPANGEDRTGLFYIPSGIATDDNGNVYVLDQEKNFIQVFSPTPFQKQLHEAINLYNEGKYDGSMKILKEVINFNNTSAFAHTYLGKNYMQQGNYEMAAEHFKIANAKDEYSQAYWEIRNKWLQHNLLYVFLVCILLSVVYFIVKHVRKKKGITQSGLKAFLDGLHRKSAVAKDILGIKYAAYHPIDNAYEVKVRHIGSILSATMLYILFFAIFVLWKVGSGFIYSIKIRNFSTATNFIYFWAIIVLFVMGNYFISSIEDGNGTIRLIYITGAYSLAPAIMILPFVAAFSNVATLDDSFLINTTVLVTIVWCAINEVCALIEIHQYNFKEIVKNILLTLFIMAVTVIVVSLGYLLIKQIIDFFKEIYVEVRLRA